jgi:hypothetical protein
MRPDDLSGLCTPNPWPIPLRPCFILLFVAKRPVRSSTVDQQEEPSAVGPICGFILANGKHSFISLLRWGLVDITLVSRPLVSFALLCYTSVIPLPTLFSIHVRYPSYRRISTLTLFSPVYTVTSAPLLRSNKSRWLLRYIRRRLPIHSWTLNRNTHLRNLIALRTR